MEDEKQDGPFAVWQMFNAPTMVLFNNLQHAGEGLERLLTSILKLSGDFSEVLVPRPGSSKFPESYYEAFNTWLLGRLYYIWTVEELNRIHLMSEEAQLKILGILCVNNASFYDKIHFEYTKVIQALIDYNKAYSKAKDPKEVVIRNFAPESIDIPNVELNLEPIFVCVKDIKTCSRLIELTLHLLSISLPTRCLSLDNNYKEYQNLFQSILDLLETSDLKTKLICLKFFVELATNFNNVSVETFQNKYQSTFKILMDCLEALITTVVAVNYEMWQINKQDMDLLNKNIVRTIQLAEDCDEYRKILETISSVILDKENVTIFNKETTVYILSISYKLNMSEDVLCIQSRDYIEIDALRKCYSENILKYLKNDMELQVVNNKLYKNVMKVLESFDSGLNTAAESFVISYHFKRCHSTLCILMTVWLQADPKHKNKINLISNETFEKITKRVKNILTSQQLQIEDKDNAIALLKIVFGLLFLVGKQKAAFKTISHFLLLQSSSKFQLHNITYCNEVKASILNYSLSSVLLTQVNMDEEWKKMLTLIIISQLKNKNTEILLQIIPLCPLVCLNNIFSESKVIGDILIPGALSKEPSIQAEICKVVPAICCMSFGDCKLIVHGENENPGHVVFYSDAVKISLICSKCHRDKYKASLTTEIKGFYLKDVQSKYTQEGATSKGQKDLFVKFLNCKLYTELSSCGFHRLMETFSNHGIFNVEVTREIFTEKTDLNLITFIRKFVENIMMDNGMETLHKDAILNLCVEKLVQATCQSLENNDYTQQTASLDCIREFGLANSPAVVLPSTKLTVYFIMHPQCSLAAKAVVYLREICEAHDTTPNQVYHRYKNDYCRLFVQCSLYNGKEFAIYLLKVVMAFGFVGYRDFISKDVHHFLPYLIPYSIKIKEVPYIIQEIASLVQCSVSEFLIERFPHVYTHLYLYESDQVSRKCYELLEKMTKTPTLSLVKKHFRVILTEFLLQFCCNSEKVLNACRYLACHDPDISTPTGSMSMSTSQIADFLQPKFLGILAYFDNKLVNTKVAVSVKRKALQSFPEIMKLMGVKYLTPLRFKVLATLRSALSLVKEFPKILAAAWSGFIHNIDTMALGPLLSNLAVSLLPQLEDAPHEINKIFQYLILGNENMLSSHISDLFFLEDSQLSVKVKAVIKRHVTRTQPDEFLDKVRWYLKHLSQDIPMIKAHAFSHLDKLLKESRFEIHKAIFGGKTIDSTMVELIDSLLAGCCNPSSAVRLASGACLGQLGAIEAAHLPRHYSHLQDRAPFAFSLSDDCFAAAALEELTRAFQYEKDTLNMNCYALSIQEMLKMYNISPTGNKQNVWDSFPEHMHQIMYPLLSSRYTLAYPSQPKKAHPLYGSSYATTFLEWAHNWAGQLIPLVEPASVGSLVRAAHPSMRRDSRTLFLFLPYVLLHALMSTTNTNTNPDYIYEEMQAVIGIESVDQGSLTSSDKARYKLLRHVRMTPTITSVHTEESNQTKCSKMVYTLLDFLNRWLLEWCHSKQHPLQNENYKSISSFVQKFDKLHIARGNFACGELERALQYLERFVDERRDRLQGQLSFLAEIYALLDEPDSVAGILSLKRSEPSLKELILAQVVTGRLQDAAQCYERLAQEGPLDTHSLEGMVSCYLGLSQPHTALRLLREHAAGAPSTRDLATGAPSTPDLAAEPLWRLARWEDLQTCVNKPLPSSRENWGLLMGKVFLAYRSQEHEKFDQACSHALSTLVSQLDADTRGESALRSGYQTVLGAHVIKEAERVEEMLRSLKSKQDGTKQCSEAIEALLEEWRRRLSLVQSDVRTVEPVLRIRRILLQQTQELLSSEHPQTASKLKSCIGDLWLQSAKQARKAGIHQQAYMYILNAEEYQPSELFIEKAKMYWGRGQKELAFTTLRRTLDEHYPALESLTQHQRKICAKAKLLIAKYNDETTSVDVDVNIGYYKEAVEAFKQWEKSLVCLGAYYEKVCSCEAASPSNAVWSRRVLALNSYGKALQYSHKYLYQSMPRMLSIWLDVEVTSSDPSLQTILAQMTEIIKTYSERLPIYLYLTAFSQIVSRICHPVKEVYLQLKAIIVKLIVAYPQHTLWMMMSVIKSSYPQRIKRCQDVFTDPTLKEPHMLKLVCDFTQLAEKLIELCNKPISGNSSTTTVTSLVRTLPRLLASDNFSHIMMPFQEFCKIVLPSKAARQERIEFDIPSEPPVYIAGIEEQITILPSLQKPRKVTLRGSDGKAYIIMLKPRDDLRKDYRLMEFNGVVNRFLLDAFETRRRRLYIRTYSVLPLNEECGLIEWVPSLLGLRPILMHIYKQKGIHTSNRELKELMCANKDPVDKKRRIYEQQLLPRHPPVFHEWFQRVFPDPYGWYQARSAYIRTTAVMSMVGYILGLGDRHGENISFDSCNGDTVHVDFNCLFNKGEAFEWPERVPFRLTHNMQAAMGPLQHEGMFRKSCEAVMSALRAQTAALMSVIGPFVYDPLVSWGRARPMDSGERTNEQALQHLQHIRQRLNGMVKTKNKQLSLSLSPEGQVEHLIVEATSIHNLCQMYIGWGPFL